MKRGTFMGLLGLMLLALLPALAPAEGEARFDAAPTLEPARPLRSARLRAVGDLMVHQKQLDIALQPDGSYDFHPQYALIADSLGDADYTIANLETTIGLYGRMDYSGFPLFNAPEAMLEAVGDAGVDFLTLANNHMLDRYFGGMVATVDAVERHGFAHGGANRSPQERDAPVVVEVNGIHIGFLCYTQMTNGMEAYSNGNATEYGINYLRRANLSRDVQRLREAGAEVIIALPHWGEEYRRMPEANTEALARRMIAAGVDVVLGSHPHMVQPVQFVTVPLEGGGERTGLVAYSLGNFIDNMTARYTDSGIILEFTLRERQDGGFDIEDVGVVPLFCWKRGDMIQTLSSRRYGENPPEDMAPGDAARMRESERELREVLGEGIPFLEK